MPNKIPTCGNSALGAGHASENYLEKEEDKDAGKESLYILKLNYRKKVFCFTLNFLPWEFLLIKKLDF